MSERRHSVRVTILGEEYTIRSDASPDHTRAVARYVDAAIRRVMGSGTVVETHKGAILAALQITDELFKARGGDEELAESIRGLSAEVRRWLPPAKRAAPGEVANASLPGDPADEHPAADDGPAAADGRAGDIDDEVTADGDGGAPEHADDAR